MAFIKHFREVQFRVPDPMRPGHTAFDRRMDTSKTHAISHKGVEYHADVDGWFDVPPDVAAYFLNFPGWCSPEMVDEEVVAGRIRADAADLQPNTREQLEAKGKSRKPAQRQKATAAARA
jgi:hypothetical protein